uniref:Hepatocyte cell adhesion molecule-like n=1 Tax=Callorhinchus milii TaxID=7868 RepID=A0A4W3HFA2_CALMI
MEFLKVASVLHCLALHEAARSASLNIVKNVAVKGDVLFPVRHRSRDEKYEVTLRKKWPVALKILGWNSELMVRPLTVHPYYTARVHLIKAGIVQFRDVFLNDSGVYELTTDYLGPVLRNNNRDVFEVRVFEPVSQPIIRVSDAFTNVTLNCSVSKGTGIAFYWKKTTYLESENFTSSGSVLVVKSGCEEQAFEYSCVAENPISQQTSVPVTIKLCAESQDRGERGILVAY